MGVSAGIIPFRASSEPERGRTLPTVLVEECWLWPWVSVQTEHSRRAEGGHVLWPVLVTVFVNVDLHLGASCCSQQDFKEPHSPRVRIDVGVGEHWG